MRFEIVEIHGKDAHFVWRAMLEGKEAVVTPESNLHQSREGGDWVAGELLVPSIDKGLPFYFYAVKLRHVEGE